MNSQKQKLLIEYLLSSPDVYAICDSVLEPRHYDADLRPAVSFLKEYNREYRAVPDFDIITAETGIVFTPQAVTRDKIEYCIREVESFAKKKALLFAVGECADLVKDGDYGLIESKLKAALAVSVQKDIGISLFEDPRTVLERIKQSERPISTGYDDCDKKLFGGLTRKQLMVISGPSGGGKSVLMNNLSLNYVESGHTVLFITLELSQDMTYLRYASMMSGMSLNGWFMNVDEMATRVEKYQSLYGGGTKGDLFLKKLPAGAKPSEIRAVLKEFFLVHGRDPDVLIVDYLDIMGCDHKVSVENVSLKDRYAAEGLREIAIDHNLICITGSQIKKEVQDTVDVGASQLAGGQTKLNTADVWGNVMLTDEMKAAGLMGIKWLKTRTSDGRGKVSLMEFNNISLRATNFAIAPTETQMRQYMNLTKRASKTFREVEGQLDADGPTTPDQTTSASNSVRSLLSSMIDMEAEQ